MNQSEIWLVDLEPARGAEIKKTRPCLIVSADSIGKLPLKVVVPLTDWKERYAVADWMVKLLPSISNNLSKESGVDCFQLRSLSQDRFIKRIGIVSSTDFDSVKMALAKVLSLF